MPLSAVATTPEIAQSAVGAGLTISTFGGNPVACAAAIGTLEEMLETYTPIRCAQIGQMLEDGLHALAKKYPLIGEVRGRGLMQGVELVADRGSKEPAPQQANAVMEASRQAGLLIGKGGMYGNTLRIAPPLSANQEHIEEALEKLDVAFAHVQENV
jgi:4-aminobutyrate aminotransferase-like enzyme